MKLDLISLQKKNVPLFLSLMKDYYTYDGLHFIKKNAHQAIMDLLKNKNLGSAWFITLNKEIIGYTILANCFSAELGGKMVFVDELFISEPFRGQGLGLKALTRIKLHCRKTGIKVMRLEVEYENKRAQRAYEKFGFQAHPRFIMSYGCKIK